MSDETPLEPATAEPSADGHPPPPIAPPAPAVERPELPVAAAFAGGFLLALLLKRRGR